MKKSHIPPNPGAARFTFGIGGVLCGGRAEPLDWHGLVGAVIVKDQMHPSSAGTVASMVSRKLRNSAVR
jgi:hypothetical protein